MIREKIFQEKVSNLAICILEIVVGVLLLINPAGFTRGIIIGTGVLMCLTGILSMVRYFMVRPEIAAQKQLLFRGLIALIAGAFLMTQHGWLITALPLLTVLYAMAMLMLAAARLQRMADCKRAGKSRWYMPGISAALAIVTAVILMTPLGTSAAVWVFAALSLIIQALFDMVMLAI